MNFIKKILLGSERKKAHDAYQKGIAAYNRLDYARAIDCFKKMKQDAGSKKHLEHKLAGFYRGMSHRNLGIVAFTRNDYDTALSHFRNAQKCNPKHIDLNYFIGICLNNLGQFKPAMDAFKIIQETEPWNVPNKLKMAIILHNLKMWTHAEEIYQNLLQKNPQFADVHYHLGIVFMNQGKTKEAADEFKQALDINPNYTNAAIKLGIALICMDQLTAAAEHFTGILNKNPDYADVNYLLSIIKLEQNDPKAAVALLRKALTVSPGFKNAQVKLIITLCRMGKVKAAEKQLEAALELYPDDQRLQSVKNFTRILDPTAASTAEISQEFKAIFGNEHSIAALRNEFHKGLDIMPNFSEIISIFSHSRFAQEDVGISDFLIPLIKEQIRKNPTYPDLYNTLGTQLNFIKNSVEAEKAFARAVALNDNYIDARINLLKTQYTLGSYQDAYENAQVILSRNLPFPDVYHTVAQVLFELKKYDSALINARKALNLQPSLSQVHLLVARIYTAQNDPDAAIHEINKHLKSGALPAVMVEAEKMLKKLQQK